MENKGKISPEVVIAMGGQVQTGDLLSCVYDLEVRPFKNNTRIVILPVVLEGILDFGTVRQNK